MKTFARLVMFSMLLGMTQTGKVLAQEKGTGPKERSLKQDIKSNKRLRQEKREKRKLEKAEQKAIKKHHKRIQTKKVLKRMKASRKKSKRINNNEKEFFLKRWLKKI
jgi:hypothetical protein